MEERDVNSVEKIWEKGISKYFGIGISWYFQIDKSQVCSMHIHQHAKCAPISMLQGTWHFNLKFSTKFSLASLDLLASSHLTHAMASSLACSSFGMPKANWSL